MAALSRAASLAQSPFDGTWLLNPAQSKLAPKPLTWSASQGWFHCVSCEPSFDVPADGQDHAVTGHSYDTASVTLVDSRTMRVVNKKDGKIVGRSPTRFLLMGKSSPLNTRGMP